MFVLLQLSVEFPFICPFSPDILPRLCLFSNAFVSCIKFQMVNRHFVGRSKLAFSLLVFKSRASLIVSSFHSDFDSVFHFITSICTLSSIHALMLTATTVTCCQLLTLILVAGTAGLHPGSPAFVMYINDLPHCLWDAAPKMFVDDTNITLSAKTVADLKLEVTSELNNSTCWLRANRLSLNVAKTELMIIGSRLRLNAQCRRFILVLMTRRSRQLIILNLWVLPLMLNSLGLNTLMKYARKPLQQLVH